MNKQQDLKILNKWIAKQLVQRSYLTEVKVETKDPFTGNIITNVVQKRVRYTEMPSFKQGISRFWYIVLPDNFTITYSEVKAKVWNTFTKSYEVNNLTQKAKDIKKYLIKKAYAHYNIEYTEGMDIENL